MMDNAAYVYIAECRDGTWYTGWSTDPERRIAVHNSGKGAKYTRSRLPVKLIYTELAADRIEAMRREYAIKQMSRAEKEKLVAGAGETKTPAAAGNKKKTVAAAGNKKKTSAVAVGNKKKTVAAAGNKKNTVEGAGTGKESA